MGRYYIATWNNYETCEEWEEKIETLKAACQFFACQQEEEGTPHLQMAMKFSKKQNCNSTKWLPSTVHFEKMRANMQAKNKAHRDWSAFWYCLREFHDNDPEKGRKRVEGGKV